MACVVSWSKELIISHCLLVESLEFTYVRLCHHKHNLIYSFSIWLPFTNTTPANTSSPPLTPCSGDWTWSCVSLSSILNLNSCFSLSQSAFIPFCCAWTWFLFWDRVSSSGWPWTCYVAKDDLELNLDPSASTSQVLGPRRVPSHSAESAVPTLTSLATFLLSFVTILVQTQHFYCNL